MNIEARKLSFIQEFLTIKNEKTISLLEAILRKEKKISKSKDTQQMTMQELNKRIEQSLKDSGERKVTEANRLISEIKKWK